MKAWPANERMWPFETITTSDWLSASCEWPAWVRLPVASVSAVNLLPSRVRRSGRVGPVQLTANTLPAASVYSRTMVPLSSVLWLTVYTALAVLLPAAARLRAARTGVPPKSDGALPSAA